MFDGGFDAHLLPSPPAQPSLAAEWVDVATATPFPSLLSLMPGVDSPAGAEALQLLRRLEDIRLEALVALDRVQHSRSGSDAAASSSSDGGGLDYELELAEHDESLAQAAAAVN